ncbi:hypothetical protein DEJ44_15190 [Streptomyces venezuelae]|uniref:hypothetical protein n=1 Tax=Streptomyces venezuelae TaxID=54571 RepID=UPI00123A7984|nr:hypothetical protein [Streptomyces venezuelae]QES06817.1 hypothetical protein DEJ44_15190 [Streptomyces venezuelae]
MAWFKKASDADLQQGMEMASHCADQARKDGNRKREGEFHEVLNGMIDEAQSRGWTDTKGGWLRRK